MPRLRSIVPKVHMGLAQMRRSIKLTLEKRRFFYAMGIRAVPFLFHEIRGTGELFLCHISGYEVWVRAGTTDFRVAWSNLNGGEFDHLPPVARNTSGSIIVDAGSYIGTSALVLAAMYPEVPVFALEPDPRNFSMLQRNTSAVSNIFPLQAALAGEDGDLVLGDPGEGAYAYTTVGVFTQGRSDIVKATTLDSLRQSLEGQRILILKMDIEGGEAGVLAMGPRSLENVDCVIAELHDFRDPACSSNFHQAAKGMEIIDLGAEKIVAYRRDVFVS